MDSRGDVATYKRKYPRRIFYGAVGVLYRGQYHVTVGGSIGEGGMSFESDTPLPMGHSVVVTFKIPQDAMLSTRAEIKNCIKSADKPGIYKIGVQFIPLPIAEKRRIRSYVSSRTEHEPII